MENNGVPMPQMLTWPPISGSIWAPERALGSQGYLVNPSGLGWVNSGTHNSVHIQLVLEARRSFNCLHKNVSCPGSCWGDRSTSLKAQGERRPRSTLPGRVMEIYKRRCLCGHNCAFARPKAPAEDQDCKWHFPVVFVHSPSQSAQQRMNERKPVTVGMTAKGCSTRLQLPYMWIQLESACKDHRLKISLSSSLEELSVPATSRCLPYNLPMPWYVWLMKRYNSHLSGIKRLYSWAEMGVHGPGTLVQVTQHSVFQQEPL